MGADCPVKRFNYVDLFEILLLVYSAMLHQLRGMGLDDRKDLSNDEIVLVVYR
ncbi:hypothetical protein D3C84_1275670 [compost metagenome]